MRILFCFLVLCLWTASAAAETKVDTPWGRYHLHPLHVNGSKQESTLYYYEINPMSFALTAGTIFSTAYAFSGPPAPAPEYQLLIYSAISAMTYAGMFPFRLNMPGIVRHSVEETLRKIKDGTFNWKLLHRSSEVDPRLLIPIAMGKPVWLHGENGRKAEVVVDRTHVRGRDLGHGEDFAVDRAHALVRDPVSGKRETVDARRLSCDGLFSRLWAPYLKKMSRGS